MRRWGGMAWVLVALSAQGAFGQPQATTVQLPTFSFFTTSTTVSVPDGGSTYLGGVNRARDGMVEGGVPGLHFPPFHNRAIGSERSAMNMSVSVTVHDMAAMDDYLLGKGSLAGSPMINGMASANDRRAALYQLTPRSPGPDVWQPRALESSLPSVAQIQADRRQQQQTRDEEAADLYQRGQVAEGAGKAGVAKIYYQMAARRAASGPMKEEILARLDALKGLRPSSTLVQGPR